MSVSIDDFWKLAVASELLSPDECQQLHGAFADLKGAAQQANVRSLAQWLVASGRLSRYQATVLASGRPGPFVFGPFVITDRVQTGRLARLYRATFEGSHEVLLVALAQLTDDPAEHQHLIETARAVAAVKSPHVSRTYNAVRHRSQTFIVVESLEGESLEELLAREKLPQAAACQIGCQLALALVAMHGAGFVHGGLCPRNVWIDQNATAKLLQFPLAASLDRLKPAEPPLVDYLAAELASPGSPFTELTDIYALGCTLFELIAGRPVFPGGTTAQRIERQRGEFPQRLDQLDPKVPEELADLVSEMLEKDPLLRCQTASHVAHLLAPFVADQKRASRPPKLGEEKLTAGYGAWTAPEWQSPPKQAAPAPSKVEPPPAGQHAAEAPQPAARTNDPTSALEAESTPKHPHDANVKVVVGAGDAKRSSTDARFDKLPTVEADPVATPSVSLPRRPPSKSVWIGIGAGVALMLLLVIGAVVANRSDRISREKKQAAEDATATADESPPVKPSVAPEDEVSASRGFSASQVNLVDDDGETLWVSPTQGQPIDPALVPSGAQVLLILRPAELSKSPEGARLLDSLGPAGEWLTGELRSTLGVEPTAVEQLIIAFVPDSSHAPQAAMVMRLAGDIPQATLLSSWGSPAPAEHAGQQYFQGARHAYYLPKTGSGRVVAIAPPAVMKQTLEIEGQPLLRRGVERLLQSSDDQRQLTVLFTPSYLLNDGRGLLAGQWAKLRDPLREFLDESIEAVLLSAHVGEQLFLEFRAVAPIDRQPRELLDLLRGRFDKIPDRVETHVASLVPHSHGRLVVNRFPRMVQLMRDYTRGGVDDGQIVMCAYLPPSAAHSLAMGAELTLAELSDSAPAVQQTAPASTPRMPLAETLKKKISLSIPRDSLDRVMDVLAGELDVEIVILGSDLQLEGITKNQSLADVDERDQPAAAILRKLLKLANPDGKLVYVIRPSPSGPEAIFITTRAAVDKRGEVLPEGF